MSNFIERLQEEKNELASKKHNLTVFIHSEKFGDVGEVQQELLYKQLSAMTRYYACLNLRLYDLEQNQAA